MIINISAETEFEHPYIINTVIFHIYSCIVVTETLYSPGKFGVFQTKRLITRSYWLISLMYYIVTAQHSDVGYKQTKYACVVAQRNNDSKTDTTVHELTTRVAFSTYDSLYIEIRVSYYSENSKCTEKLHVCHALVFISKSKATPHIQLDTMQLFDTISDCGRKLQTLELIRENSEAIHLDFLLYCRFRLNRVMVCRLFFH